MAKQIPNILSVIRLLMIPVFVVTYAYSKTVWAAIIYVAAWITDALDGYLARRNNWITDVGKLLDPLADKCMQFAAAICFSVDNPIFLLVAIPMFVKEISMLLAAIFIMKEKKIVVASNWYGKVATVILFLCAFTKIIMSGDKAIPALDITLALLMLACMIFSFLMYYFKDFKGKYKLDFFRKN